jgi:SRSO17 transposase
MTYLYYQTTSTTGGQLKVNDKTNKTKKEWEHLANKENWRIVQLPNGYYQTEVSNPDNESWHDVTRRETLEGAESAIDGSIDHFNKKLEATKGPKVVKTFKK